MILRTIGAILLFAGWFLTGVSGMLIERAKGSNIGINAAATGLVLIAVGGAMMCAS